MAQLQIKRRTVDLSTVAGLSNEEYAGLIYYAKQWDDPQQDDWVAALEEARSAKKPAKEKKTESE